MTMKLTTTEFSFNASLSCIDLGHIAESMEEINLVLKVFTMIWWMASLMNASFSAISC